MESDVSSSSPFGSAGPAEGWPNVDPEAYRYYRDLTPPRRSALLDQVKQDLSSPVAAIGWLLVFASLGFGGYLLSPPLFGLGFAGVIVFGRSFLRCVRTRRDGVLVRFIADELIGPYNVKGGALVGDVALAGKVHRVGAGTLFERAQEMLAKHGRVEVLAVVEPKRLGEKGRTELALSIRPAADDRPVVGARKVPRARVVEGPRRP